MSRRNCHTCAYCFRVSKLDGEPGTFVAETHCPQLTVVFVVGWRCLDWQGKHLRLVKRLGQAKTQKA